MTVSFRVPASWRPLLKELIPTSVICQHAVLRALQQQCPKRDAQALELSLAAIATGETTRFKPTTIFPKHTPAAKPPLSSNRRQAYIDAVRRDLEAFKAELRDEE